MRATESSGSPPSCSFLTVNARGRQRFLPEPPENIKTECSKAKNKGRLASETQIGCWRRESHPSPGPKAGVTIDWAPGVRWKPRD